MWKGKVKVTLDLGQCEVVRIYNLYFRADLNLVFFWYDAVSELNSKNWTKTNVGKLSQAYLEKVLTLVKLV